MIKTVIFDWGEVITGHTFSDLVDYCAKLFEVEPEELSSVLLENWKDLHTGDIEEPDFWRKIGGLMDFTPPERESIWKDAMKEKYIEREGMLPLIENLRKRNYKTGLLSNAEVNVVKLFEEMPHFNKLFDTAVFSCSINMAKPDREIYEYTLDQLGAKAEESVFIDDKLENIEGAEKLGIKGIHFKGYEDLIENLKKLEVDFE